MDFFTGALDEAVERSVGRPKTGDLKPEKTISSDRKSAGSGLVWPIAARLVVAPSAPGLAVDLVQSTAYREALTTADLVLTDSGYMVLLWRAFTGEKLPRHSGLKFLRAVLARPELKEPGAIFWVMPSSEEDVRNRSWLNAQGFPTTQEDTYIAPHYGSGGIEDCELLRRIEARRPKVVILAIGGGVQERLGFALRKQLKSCQPGILCLGAAIAFLTGGQANIPPWADKLVLGGLLRLLRNPRKFWRRYWEALPLAALIWNQRERLPALRVKC